MVIQIQSRFSSLFWLTAALWLLCQVSASSTPEVINAEEQDVIGYSFHEMGQPQEHYNRQTYSELIEILEHEEPLFLNQTAKYRPQIQQNIRHNDLLTPSSDWEMEESLNVKIRIHIDYSITYERARKRVLNSLLTDNQLYAIDSLHKLSNQSDDLSATIALGDIYIFGNYSIPTDYPKALEYYTKASLISDDAHVNFMLGFIYSTGLFGQVEMNQAKALIHYKLAAEKGHLKAAMCLGYRYYTGFTVPKDLSKAIYYYSMIAEHSYAYLKDGYIGTRDFISYNIRVADFAGGIYGEHASESSSSIRKRYNPLAKDDKLFMDYDLTNELLTTYNYEAHKAFNGYYTEEKDYKKAYDISLQCVQLGEQTQVVEGKLAHNAYDDPDVFVASPSTNMNPKDQVILAQYSQCASLLGHLLMRGEGCEQDFERALEYLTKSFKVGNSRESALDLGLLAELGIGIKDDSDPLKEASSWFLRSTYASEILKKEKYYPAKFHLARNTLLQGTQDPKTLSVAYKSIEEAAYKSNLEAIYLLSNLQLNGDIESKIEDTSMLFRAFVEKVEPAVTDLKWAFYNLLYENKELALIGYGMAAEQGYESAQSSVAYLLYPSTSLTEELPFVPLEHYQSALNYYRRSSQQFNLDSANFLGDLYYRGFTGKSFKDYNNKTLTRDYTIEPDYEKAALIYQEAASKKSPQAYFNLGYMHEMGKGVPQDFYLAKRYYDLVLSSKPDSYISVQISLWRLYTKLWWYKIWGIEVSGGHRNDHKVERTWNDWLNMYERLKEKGRRDFNEDMSQMVNDEYNYLTEAHNDHYNGLGPGANTNTNVNDDEFISLDEDDMLIFLIVFFVILIIVISRIVRRNQNLNRNLNRNQNNENNEHNDNAGDVEGEVNANGNDNGNGRFGFRFEFHLF